MLFASVSSPDFVHFFLSDLRWLLSSCSLLCSAGLFNRHVPVILDVLKKGKMEPLVPIPVISMVQVMERDVLRKRSFC